MNADPTSNNENALPRRQFIRKMGTSVFTVTVMNVLHLAPSAYGAQCGGGVTDWSCGPATYGYYYLYPAEPDQNCNQPDPTHPGWTDPDTHCSATASDASCRPVQIPSTGPQADEHCSVNNPDQGCSIAQNTGPGDENGDHDADAHCSAQGSSADSCCGDCEDNHQTDSHCGQAEGGGTDADELCGHTTGSLGVFWVQPDGACGKSGAVDSSCGAYDLPFSSVTPTDFDNTCGVSGNPDQWCNRLVNPGPDETCARPTNPSSSSPDEYCGTAGSADAACGHYDPDAGCSACDPDNGCGWKYLINSVQWIIDPDDACTLDDSDVSHHVNCT